MYRLSAIIEEAFSKNLLVAEKYGVSLNLDFPDPTKRIQYPSKVKNPLFRLLPESIERAARDAKISRRKAKVSLLVKRDGVVISDNGAALSREKLLELNSVENISAKSRVGFGTEILIKFS